MEQRLCVVEGGRGFVMHSVVPSLSLSDKQDRVQCLCRRCSPACPAVSCLPVPAADGLPSLAQRSTLCCTASGG